ncbi:MAG: SusC/RagA family TonB-linked outer membrane protein [Bacteroidales bacterium]|nr:SusC/RagA family TonB-linked outer membrane protein [Bacteroidales bacterium]MBQ6687975.1 SusC/RagA family TonB-linked outer membrane protein [Bacteroidales bacterium]
MLNLRKPILVFIAFMCAIVCMKAQNTTISGTVTGSDGYVLTGATLITDGGGSYALTDADGKFTLEARDGSTVTVSYIGYDDFIFTAAGQQGMEITLPLSADTVLEESVAIGYGKTTKKEVTGSVVSLKSDDFDKGSYTSPIGMLQGKVAGLTITNPDGGDPNASFEILLRGTNTLVAGQGPLVIIDGVAGGDMRTINFQEVESIDVLKDGSAAAIYGTRGTNGVIIITTKRAKAGTTSVEYDGQVSVQTVAARALPLNAEQYAYAIKEFNPTAAKSLYGADTDWFKEITRTPISHKHSLAIAGGSEKFSHRTVLNIEQNQGLQKKNDSQKYLIKTNLHQEAIEGWLTFDYNLSYTKRKYSPANYSAFRQAFLRNPTEPVYDESNVDAGGYFTIDAMDYYNPVAMIEEKDAENDIDTFSGSIRATLNILPVKGLKWDNFISYNNERYESREYLTKYYPSALGQNGVGYVSNSYSSDVQYESTLQYSNVFGKHNVQAILGYAFQETNSRESSMENYGFDFDEFYTNNMGAGTALQEGLASMGSYRGMSRYIAFFGRIMYNYDERYLASVSLRRDGSSKFGKDNKWGWFPAVSLGWRINQEKWLKDASWLSELKLRAGFGVTGNQDFSSYKSLLLMEPFSYYYFDGKWVTSYAPASNANPDLAWERKNEFNVGLDFAFFDNRFGGTVDYYYRLTTNLLYNYTVPVPPYDYGTIFTNVGSICNQGIEVTLYGTPVKRKVFEWNTNLTLAKNTNKLISFTNEEFTAGEYKVGYMSTPIGSYSQRLIEGHSLGTFYAPIWTGVNKKGEDILEGANKMTGRVKEEEWQEVGSAYPDLTFGWSNNFRIGNFGLSATFRGQIGGKVFNTYRALYENISNLGESNILASWMNDTSFKGKEIKYSTKYIEDASYLKLDNVSASYDFSFNNKYVKKLRLYLTAQNLFCLTGYSGVDPEVSLSGIAPGIEGTSYYPRTRTFTFGATITF